MPQPYYGTGLSRGLNTINQGFSDSFNVVSKLLEYDDRLRRSAKDDELRALQMDSYRFELDGKRQQRLAEEEEGELLAAMNSGDMSVLRPELAIKINKYVADQNLDPEYIANRTGSAKIISPIIGKLAEQAEQIQQQAQTGTAPGLQQQDIIHLSSDPSFDYLKPHLKNVFFGRDRFSEGGATPKLYKYDVNGRVVFGTVDQADPVADVLFQQSTGRIMVPPENPCGADR